MSSRWGTLEQAVVAKLKTGTTLKFVAGAPSADSVQITAFPAAIVSVFGTSTARGEAWAVRDFVGARMPANDWIHLAVLIIAGSSGGSPDPELLRLARDEVRSLLQGYEPVLVTDKPMEPLDSDGELPGEDNPEISIEMLWRVGVFSQEGLP